MNALRTRVSLAFLCFAVLACTPLNTPGLMFPGYAWVQPFEGGNLQGIISQFGATAYAEVHENDSGSTTVLTNLSPELLMMDEVAPGEYAFHAVAFGEAQVRYQNQCSDLGAPCNGIMTVLIVDADNAEWTEDFVAVRGGTAVARALLFYEDDPIVSAGGFISHDGEVDHETGTIAFEVPLEVDTHEVEIRTVGGSHLFLEVPLIDFDQIRSFDLECFGDSCSLRVESLGGEAVKGAPVVWTYEGEPLPMSAGRPGSRVVIDADRNAYSNCELCADLVDSPARSCATVICGAVQLLP